MKKDWSQLKILHVSANHIGSEGAKILASGNWPNLEILQIFDCDLGNEGVEAIITNKWPAIVRLHLCIFLFIKQIIKLTIKA